MNTSEFLAALAKLGLTQTEAAKLLSVTDRTIRRWLDSTDPVPGLAANIIRAWLTLERHHIPWRPGSISLISDDVDQYDRHREHAVDLASLLEKVAERGGPATFWHVDHDLHKATLESTMEVHFWPLANGGFSLHQYRRLDGLAPDRQRDQSLIEDATASYAARWPSLKPSYDRVHAYAHNLHVTPERTIEQLLDEHLKRGGVTTLYPGQREALTVKARSPIGEGYSLWFSVVDMRGAPPTDIEYEADLRAIQAWIKAKYDCDVIWAEVPPKSIRKA